MFDVLIIQVRYNFVNVWKIMTPRATIAISTAIGHKILMLIFRMMSEIRSILFTFSSVIMLSNAPYKVSRLICKPCNIDNEIAHDGY